VGDTPSVVGECLKALLQLAPRDSLPLATALLEAGSKESDPRAAVEMAEVTALALGESRLPEALAPLKTWWQRTTHPELRQIALLAITTLRQDEAIQFLLHLLAAGALADARDALAALNVYCNDEFLWPQVERILVDRTDLSAD
jgi:hypothetical protein